MLKSQKGRPSGVIPSAPTGTTLGLVTHSDLGEESGGPVVESGPVVLRDESGEINQARVIRRSGIVDPENWTTGRTPLWGG